MNCYVFNYLQLKEENNTEDKEMKLFFKLPNPHTKALNVDMLGSGLC